MPERGEIHITGPLREDIDIDLLAQLVIMLGHQLSRETMCEGATSGGPPAAIAEDSA